MSDTGRTQWAFNELHKPLSSLGIGVNRNSSTKSSIVVESCQDISAFPPPLLKRPIRLQEIGSGSLVIRIGLWLLLDAGLVALPLAHTKRVGMGSGGDVWFQANFWGIKGDVAIPFMWFHQPFLTFFQPKLLLFLDQLTVSPIYKNEESCCPPLVWQISHSQTK